MGEYSRSEVGNLNEEEEEEGGEDLCRTRQCLIGDRSKTEFENTLDPRQQIVRVCMFFTACIFSKLSMLLG